jgi:hypothetical protein
LLGRIKTLRNRRDEDSTKELLSTLASLEEILSEEILEALDSSGTVLADEGR